MRWFEVAGRAAAGLVVAIVASSVVGCSGDEGTGGEGTGVVPDGVERIMVTSREHTDADVDYPTIPPAGGDHLGVWHNCGLYTVELHDEAAVHSLEHGAVWITYRPDVGVAGIVSLTGQLTGVDKVLLSPYPDQEAAVVATAWARRLELDGPDDPRLLAFVDTYRDAETAPEPGVACEGGIGEPPADPLAGLR
ncbi:MAG: DUF3105 domain-containing protein [Actinobacteria bacterium]|nr:DUF3105 domain-containing protein [Actinomycetota bacterium]